MEVFFGVWGGVLDCDPCIITNLLVLMELQNQLFSVS